MPSSFYFDEPFAKQTFSPESCVSASTEIAVFKHVPALDGLRAVAVLLVMLLHVGAFFPEFAGFAKFGGMGVDIFFVLSGFLITCVLLKEHNKTGGISLKNFYVRRGLRLMPAYWFFLIVLYTSGSLLLSAERANTTYAGGNFIYSFFYLTNWISAAAPDNVTGALTHTWSLAVEEQFYVLWSLLLFVFFRQKMTRSQLFYLTLFAVGALAFGRALRASTGGAPGSVLYFSTETRIDAMLIGCAAAMVYMWKLLPKTFYKSFCFDALALGSAGAAIFVFAGCPYSDVNYYSFALPVFTASIAVIVLWLATRETSVFHSVLEIKAMGWTGRISYGLYLWHSVMYEASGKFFASSAPGVRVFIGIFLAFAAASVSYYLVEKIFLSAKDKLTGAVVK